MRKTLVEKLLIKKVEVGKCELDVAMVIKLWKSRWSISQIHDEYTFYAGKLLKVQISKSQALEIIRGLQLIGMQSTAFNYGITWRTIYEAMEMMMTEPYGLRN